jgi:ferredoxin
VKVRSVFISATGVSCPDVLPMVPVGDDAGLVEALSAIAPHKAGFWQTRATTSLIVATRTAEPFGLSRAQVEEHILKTGLLQAAEAVAQRFGVDVVFEESENACPVDLESFCGLYSIATTGAYADAVLVSCFLAPESVYVSYVARGTPLGTALRSFPVIAEYLSDHAGDQPAHLLTGTPLPLDTPCSHLTSLIHFPQDGYALGANDSWLLPFPVFNRRLSMREGTPCKSSPVPCSNCMACERFCPAGIRPAFIYHHLQADDPEGAAAFGLDACIQCGWCSHVCPSALPLAQTIIAEAGKCKEGGDSE